MANAYTQKSSLDSIGTLTYEQIAKFALRDQFYFHQFATVRPTSQSHNGSSVRWFFHDEMAAATTPLVETTDPDAVAISDTYVDVTQTEYGNVVNVTAKAEAEGLFSVDAVAANLIGYNAGLTMDTMARTVLTSGSNVLYGNDATSTVTVGTNDPMSGALIGKAVAKLRGANVMGWSGDKYACVMHPDQSYDVRREVGVADWAVPAGQSDAQRIWNGYVGSYAGAMVIEAPRTTMTANAGTVDVYKAVMVGQEALAYIHANRAGYGAEPSIVVGPVVDSLERFRPIGWKLLAGWGRFREAALYRLETASSIGANT
jgi:N4-gp56 family major capsid protein